MSRSPTGEVALVGGSAGNAVAHVAWFTVLFLTPLSLPLEVLRGSVDALGLVSSFRAALVGVGLVVCTLGYIAVAPQRSQTFGGRSRAPAWLLLLLGLVAWVLLSTPFGNLAPWLPTLGSFDRMDGTLVITGWLLLVLACYGLARFGPLSETTVLRWALAAALITSLWAYLQGMNADPLTLMTGLYFSIPAGAFGHGALSAMFIGFVGLIVAMKWSSLERLRAPRLVVFGILGIGLGASGGRAAIFGVLVGAVLVAVARARSRRALTNLGLLAVVVIVGMALPLITTHRAQRQAKALVWAFEGTDGSFNSRLHAWRGGLRLLLANPVFGVGPEGFAYGVWDLLSPEERGVLIHEALHDAIDDLALEQGDYYISGNVIAYTNSGGTLSITNLRWDKAHNYLLDLGLTSGIPAVLAFLGFVGLAFVTMWRSKSGFAKGAAAATVGFLVFGLAWFPTVNLDPVTWSLVGSGIGFAARSDRHAHYAGGE